MRFFEWLLGYDAGTFNLDSHFNLTFSVYATTCMIVVCSSGEQCLSTGTPCLTRGSGQWYPKSQLGKEILRRLIEAKDEAKLEGASEKSSVWPHFIKVHFFISPIMCDTLSTVRSLILPTVSIGFDFRTSVYRHTP